VACYKKIKQKNILAGGKHSRGSVLKAGQGCLIENVHGISAEKAMSL